MSHRIYLASSSPRRRMLLEQIGVTYRVQSVEVDETVHPGEAARDYVLRVARAKAQAGRRRVAAGDPHPVLGADTVIELDNEVLGKPAGRSAGLDMLARLSSRSHRVLSAVAAAGVESEAARLSVTTVHLRASTRRERERYWNTGEPVDKAGAYAIQGLGAVFVERIDGSYSGVMGLPLYETAELLKEFGIDVVQG